MQGFGFPINNEARDVKHATAKNHFPFEAVEVSSVKIKHIPIKFRWETHGVAKKRNSVVGG